MLAPLPLPCSLAIPTTASPPSLSLLPIIFSTFPSGKLLRAVCYSALVSSSESLSLISGDAAAAAMPRVTCCPGTHSPLAARGLCCPVLQQPSASHVRFLTGKLATVKCRMRLRPHMDHIHGSVLSRCPPRDSTPSQTLPASWNALSDSVAKSWRSRPEAIRLHLHWPGPIPQRPVCAVPRTVHAQSECSTWDPASDTEKLHIYLRTLQAYFSTQIEKS